MLTERGVSQCPGYDFCCQKLIPFSRNMTKITNKYPWEQKTVAILTKTTSRTNSENFFGYFEIFFALQIVTVITFWITLRELPLYIFFYFCCKAMTIVVFSCSFFFGLEIETATHFLLHNSNYHCARQSLYEKVNKTDSTILMENDQVVTKILLFGNEKLKFAQNKSILTSTIEFLQATDRFKTSLFNYVLNGMVPLTHCHF